MRKKANYEDADTFVLGAAGELDARRLGQALIIVADATVAALEALTSAYVGPTLLANMVDAYAKKNFVAAHLRRGPSSRVVDGPADRHSSSLSAGTSTLEPQSGSLPGSLPLGSACGTEKCVSAISWVGDGSELS